ncbi:MAG: efflux RND transporter periplasmic adaptor subunit [Clostridiales bacterium]|nr:efflux RND transporter periplasmic adaptor subunit [Clostridiales bacterium]
MKKRNLWLAFMILLLSCNGCGLLPQEPDLPRAPVVSEVEDVEHAVTTVMRGDVIMSVNVACQYKPARVESLAFSVSGEYIRCFFVQPGDAVEPGDLLGELVMDDLEEQKADEDWKLKKLELEHEHTLAFQDLDLRKADAAIDLASGSDARKQARQNRERTEERYAELLKEQEDELLIQSERIKELEEKIRGRQIYASISGSVTRVKVLNDGDVSKELEKVITISDVNSSAFLVTGEDAALFKVGDEVLIKYGEEEHEAVAVDPKDLGLKGDPETAYFSLHIPDPALEEGTKGVINVILEKAEDVLYVKSGTIKKAGDQSVVYYLDEEGMKKIKEVETGLDNGTYVEIISGLEEGEEIVDE